MVQIRILTHSAVYRAGLTAVLLEAGDFQIRDSEALEDLAAEGESVVILFSQEAGEYQAEIFAHACVLIVDRNYEGLRVPGEREKGWGIVAADAPGEDLAAVIEAVARGNIVYPVTAVWREEIIDRGGPASRLTGVRASDNLTAREIEILHALAQGSQNKQIAVALKISENTVKFHVSALYAKLDAANRAEAVQKGYQLGLISM